MIGGGFASRLHRAARAAATVRTTLKIDTFIAAGTWTRPTLGTFWGPESGTANRVRVKLWAPGGGGNTNVGAGGGGAFAQGNDVDVSGAGSFAIAGVANVGATVNGTDATFGSTLVVAKGGLSGGNGGTGGQAAACTGDTKYSGGDGQVAAGTTTAGGGAGSAGAAGASGLAGEPEGGLGGAGSGAFLSAGGGSTASTQLAGARGQAQVEYFVEQTADYPLFKSYAITRSASGTSHVVTMPSGIQVGDLLLLKIGSDGTSTISVSGWTLLVDQLESNNAIRGAVYYRVATGSDTATVVTSASTRVIVGALRFDDAGTPEATITNGNGVNANPVSHTASGGTVKGIWIATVVWDANAVMSLTGAPTTPSAFGNWIAAGAVNGNGSRFTLSMLQSEASSVDPGNYTAATEQWVSATVLIPYAA